MARHDFVLAACLSPQESRLFLRPRCIITRQSKPVLLLLNLRGRYLWRCNLYTLWLLVHSSLDASLTCLKDKCADVVRPWDNCLPSHDSLRTRCPWTGVQHGQCTSYGWTMHNWHTYEIWKCTYRYLSLVGRNIGGTPPLCTWNKVASFSTPRIAKVGRQSIPWCWFGLGGFLQVPETVDQNISHPTDRFLSSCISAPHWPP